MSAALHLVPDPDDNTTDADVISAETVAAQWNPESQFIGALMWLSATRAAPLLALVPDTAIFDPVTRWAYHLVSDVVDAGADPGPVAVLAAGRTRCSIAAAPGAPSPRRHHRLAVYLFEAYSAAIAPEDSAAEYARMVLEGAYQRAFDRCGQKMCQLSVEGADRATLTTEFAAIRDELADLWRRAEAAVNPAGPTP